MLRVALKASVPLLAAAGLLMHSLPGEAASRIGLTDEAGLPGDCRTPVHDAACARLFDGSQPLSPGGPANAMRVRISYQGGKPAAALGVYVANFTARTPGSAAICTAPDPTDKLNVRLAQGSTVVYDGTLSELAREHAGPAGSLQLRPQSSTFTIAVSLDPTAGNSYMGCVSTADLVWIASQ